MIKAKLPESLRLVAMHRSSVLLSPSMLFYPGGLSSPFLLVYSVKHFSTCVIFHCVCRQYFGIGETRLLEKAIALTPK